MNQMKFSRQVKEELYEACVQNIEMRLDTISKTMKSIEESRNNQTKSSAGDKYETGRAMMQIEDDKSKRQLIETNQVKNVLSKIDLDKKFEQVELGSLAITSKGKFFMSIGIGKVATLDDLYYCISVNSPIGSKILGKEVGIGLYLMEVR